MQTRAPGFVDGMKMREIDTRDVSPQTLTPLLGWRAEGLAPKGPCAPLNYLEQLNEYWVTTNPSMEDGKGLQ